MNGKVIFLDIDGVLNDQEYLFSTGIDGLQIDENKVTLLKKIVDATNAHIVLSSSWRSEWKKGYCKEYEDLFEKYNLKIEDFTGYTDKTKEGCKRCPYDINCIEPDSNCEEYQYFGRGLEIRMYLKENPEITKYVILDDDDYDLIPYRNVHVQSSFYNKGGLTEELVNQAIEVLK